MIEFRYFYTIQKFTSILFFEQDEDEIQTHINR